MGTSSSQLNVQTDNVLEISDLYDAMVGITGYITNASVVAHVTEQTPVKPTAGQAVTSESAGAQTGIVVSGNTLVAGQKVFIVGTVNHSGIFTLQTGTSATKLIINNAYVAEVMSGNEDVFLIVPGGDSISLEYIAGTNATYRGRIPNNIDINIGSSYYVFIVVNDGIYMATSRVLYRADYLQG